MPSGAEGHQVEVHGLNKVVLLLSPGYFFVSLFIVQQRFSETFLIAAPYRATGKHGQLVLRKQFFGAVPCRAYSRRWLLLNCFTARRLHANEIANPSNGA